MHGASVGRTQDVGEDDDEEDDLIEAATYRVFNNHIIKYQVMVARQTRQKEKCEHNVEDVAAP